MKKEKRFQGIQSKIISYFVVLFLLISLVTGFIQYKVNTGIQFEGIRADAEHMAVAASLVVDGDRHEKVANAQNAENEDYERIRADLREFMEKTDANAVYTLIKNDEDAVEFIIDADDDPVELGYQYNLLSEMKEAFAGTVSAEEEVSSDEWGTVLSGYANIENSQGETIGIVGVDIDASQVAQVEKQQFKILSLGALFGSITMLILSILIAKRITHPINTLVELFDELSTAGGDLTKKIKIKTGDEIELLAQSVNDFIENIRSIIIQVKDTGQDVGSSAESLNVSIHENQIALEEVNTAIENIAAGASEQARDVTDIATGIQTISSDMVESENRLLNINEATVETRELIDNGLAAVNNSRLKTEENMSAFQKVTDVVQKLVHEVDEIGHIVSSITDISNQTNLLALNASIEAARAGEHGRGFSVVADEVRILAEESATATTEISQILNNINSGVEEVVQQISDAAYIAEDQKTAVASTSRTFDAITTEVENVIEAIRVISSSLTDIGDQTNSLVGKTQDVSSVSEENAAMTEEVSASSEQQNAEMHEMGATAKQLNELSSQLEQLIATFII